MTAPSYRLVRGLALFFVLSIVGGLALLLILTVFSPYAASAPAGVEDERREYSAAEIEFYENRIRPLLVERCASCHGAEKRRSGLRLDRMDGWLAGGERGAAVMPGDPEHSLLWRAVTYEDDELRMPPKGKLDDASLADLRKWIEMGCPAPPDPEEEDGARDEEFDMAARSEWWCFRPLAPADDLGIDERIAARLTDAGLVPAPPASPRAWIRRVTFDLTGLPPTPAEVRAFEQDASPGAKAAVVDRLLASPAYGEHWARHWLDLVRYAETRGHEFDFPIPNAWAYRDYVVRAFNADVPYDQLVREHVAGDLLPAPRVHPTDGTNESVLGTGFWYLGEAVHSPVDVRADQCDRSANQVDVLTKAFLGLTVACARCHDHKFDAIRQEDFYALAGFAISGSYQQVRYESQLHNAEIARALVDLREEHDEDLRRAVGARLEREAEDVSRRLLAADAALASDALPPAEGARADVLFDDFERDLWAPWVASGDTFGDGPVRAADLPDYQGAVGQVGERLVNTHASRLAEGRAGDGRTGRLTSPEFTITHRYIRFKIGGGDEAGRTCVQLAVDGEVAREETGRDRNEMHDACFDVRDLRGRRARIVVVDEATGGWGNVGADHFVFTDAAAPEDEARMVREYRIAREAERAGLDAELLLPWVAALEEARDRPAHPLALWAAVGGAAPEEFEARLGDWWDAASERRDAWREALAAGRVHVDYARAPRYLQNGFSFGDGPREAGAWVFAESGEVLGLQPRDAAARDAFWRSLEVHEDAEKHPGALDWVQAGRTLKTPTFELGGGRLFYLVRGAGRAYAAVDQHRMVNGPLHGVLLKTWEAGGGYRWIEQDLSEYAGHLAHVEFTPVGDGPLEVALVLEADRAPELPPPALMLAALDRSPPRDRAELARLYADLAAGAARRLREGNLRGRHAGARAELLNLVLASGTEPSAAEERYAARQVELLSRVRVESRIAPAMLESTGSDERFLVRGSPRSPADLVPRRFLEVFGGAPAQVEGSGRLALAHELTSDENPLFARVVVNRVWHHLFGRGIVASVDDFGAMGRLPSHPGLLDHLARRMIAGGWSFKQLLREVCLTDTYGRSSTPSARALEIDPTNELLQHMPVRRLTGEAVRDAILAVAGTLDRTPGGPSVPVHLTPFMEGRGRPSSGPLDGAGRRSLYIAVRRNFLTPFFSVFDFPVPATTMGRRTVSNVPAQALTLMNDPFVVEQARRWAERVLEQERGRDADARIAQLYWDAFARDPEPAELRTAREFVAAELAQRPEEEVWADLCHVLFNVKEFVFLD